MTVPNVERAILDVSSLPKVAFGKRSLSFWATSGFIAVEGTTLAVLLTSYLYIRTNSTEWPPGFIPPPDLLFPTIQLVLQLLSVWPALKAKQTAKTLNRSAVTGWLWVMTIFALITCVVRGFELSTLNVKWDENAYGSTLWGVYVSHTTLILTDFLECGVMAFFFATGRNTKRFYSDVEDAAEYQYFLTAVWVLCYLVVIIGPRSFLT